MSQLLISAIQKHAHLFKTTLLQDDYSVGEVLGSGAYSKVHAGVSKTRGTPVAIKLLKQSAYNTAAAVQDLVNEIGVLKQIADAGGHDHILKFHAAYAEQLPGGKLSLAIVTERCSGGDMFDSILELANQGKTYNEGEIAKLFRGIFSAVNFMHTSISALHCDIKHENFLLTSRTMDGRLVVGDFGMVTRVADPAVPQKGIRRGTWGYMDPDLLDSSMVSAKTDTWALGIALYVCLKASVPYDPARIQRYGASAIRAYPISCTVEDLQVSEQAADLLSHLLAVDTDARYNAAAALQHPFLKDPEEHAGTIELDTSALRRYRARQRLRAATRAVEAGSYLRKISGMRKMLRNASFPAMRVETMRSAFMRHASRSDGSDSGTAVGKEAFCAVLTELGLHALPAEALFREFDVDHDGEVDFREWMCSMAMLQGPTEQALRLCFQVYDEDGNGTLSPTELAAVLRLTSSGNADRDKVASEDLASALGSMDTDGDGEVSWDEFKTGVVSNPALANALMKPVQSRTSAAGLNLFQVGMQTPPAAPSPAASPVPPTVPTAATAAAPSSAGEAPTPAVVVCAADSSSAAEAEQLKAELSKLGVTITVHTACPAASPDAVVAIARAAANSQANKAVVALYGPAGMVLPGILAAHTELPVVAWPVQSAPRPVSVPGLPVWVLEAVPGSELSAAEVAIAVARAAAPHSLLVKAAVSAAIAARKSASV